MFNINNIWNELKRDDKIKLILAYVVIPIFNVLICVPSYSLPDGMLFYAVFISLLDIYFIGLLPTIFRFVIKKDGLETKNEVFCYLFLFGSIVSIFYYLINSSFHFPSITELFLIYLILSYKCKCVDGELPSLLMIFVIIICVVFAVAGIRRKPEVAGSTLLACLILAPFGLFTKTKENKKASESTTDKGLLSNTTLDNDNTIIGTHIKPVKKEPELTASPQKFPAIERETIEPAPIAGDLLLRLSSGVRIYLSNVIALESVKYQGEIYAEVFGCTPIQRYIVLKHGGIALKLSGQEHILLPTTKVEALSYILKDARVLNIYDAPIRDIEPPANSPEPNSGKNDTAVEFAKPQEPPLVKNSEPVQPMKSETPHVVMTKTEQQESAKKLNEYNKWLSQQADFPEFGKWLLSKLKARGLTYSQLNEIMKKYVERKGGDYQEAQKLIASWYEQFHKVQQKKKGANKKQ